jgi:hypothetical protein
MYGSIEQHDPASAPQISGPVKHSTNLGFRFDDLPGVFEIVALGHFAENVLVESDPTILVLLRVPGGPSRVRAVSATLLGRLTIGIKLENGRFSHDPALGAVEAVRVTGELQRSVKLEYALGNSLEAKSDFQTWWVEKIGSQTLWSSARNVWIEIVPAVGADQKPVHLLIPHTVIFQSYFASSSRLIRAVLRNSLDAYESAGRLLDEDNSRVGTVMVQPGWSDFETLFAARLLGSPKAVRAVNLINASLVEAADHHRTQQRPDSKQAFPMRTCLPFEGSSEMTIRSVVVPNNAKIRTLLVHEILKCSGSTGLDRHRVIRETRPSRKDVKAPDTDPDAEALVRQSVIPHPDGIIDEASEPSSDVPGITNRRSNTRFENILAQFERERVTAINSTEGNSNGDSTNHIASEVSATNNFSAGQRTICQEVAVQSAGTGEAIAGGTASPLQFADVPESRPNPPAFELAIRAAESLVISHGIRFEPFCVLKGERILEGWSSFVPSTVDSLHVAWASGELNRITATRRVLVLELQLAAHYVYIFEIERLDGDEGRYQMALLMHPNRGALQPKVVQNILKDLATAKGIWSSMDINLRSVRLNHVTDQEPLALADRWIKKWRKLLVHDTKKAGQVSGAIKDSWALISHK